VSGRFGPPPAPVPGGRGPDPDDTLAHLLGGPGQPPVFIMGDHRSGTTLLHLLLAATGCFDLVTVYHVLDYGQLLVHRWAGVEAEAQNALAAGLIRHGLVDRVIDGVAVTPDLPEEYAFILTRRGGALRLGPRNRWRFHQMRRKLAWLSGATRPLLLKSPYDVDQAVALRALAPGARFIFIHRDPVAIVNSRLRAVRQVVEHRSPYYALLDPGYRRLTGSPLLLGMARRLFAPSAAAGLAMVRHHVWRICRSWPRQHTVLAAEEHIALRYEDVCAEPARHVRDILGFLGLRPDAEPDYAALVRPRALGLLPEVERAAGAIRQETAAYCRAWAYR